MNPFLIAAMIGAALGKAEKSGLMAKVPHASQVGPYATLAGVGWLFARGNALVAGVAMWSAGMAAHQWTTTGTIGAPEHDKPV